VNTSPRHWRTAGSLAAAALVVSALFPTPWADAHAQHRLGVRRLTWSFVQDPPVISPPVCDANGACIVPFSLVGRDDGSGDISGTSIQAGTAVRLPDGSLYATSTLVFTGTIQGCGAGTVAMRSTGLNRAGVTSGDVVVIEGSGTGDLAGLEGSGTVAGQADPGGGGGGSGTVAMRLRCGEA
jgi:hypothetical protein